MGIFICENKKITQMGHTYLKKLFYICTENLKDEQIFRHTAHCAYSFH